MGLPGGPRAKKTKKGDPFLGIPGGSLLGPVWRQNFKMVLSKAMFGVFFSDSKKAVKMELPKGGRICNPTMPVHVS